MTHFAWSCHIILTSSIKGTFRDLTATGAPNLDQIQDIWIHKLALTFDFPPNWWFPNDVTNLTPSTKHICIFCLIYSEIHCAHWSNIMFANYPFWQWNSRVTIFWGKVSTLNLRYTREYIQKERKSSIVSYLFSVYQPSQCITQHLLNSFACFFCKEKITQVERINPDDRHGDTATGGGMESLLVEMSNENATEDIEWWALLL